MLIEDFLLLPQDDRYREAVASFGRDVARLVAGYERGDARRQELLQDVHFALWQSLAGFRGQCALRTWVYRVAHNACATHIARSLRDPGRGAVAFDEVPETADEGAAADQIQRSLDLRRILALVHALRLPDRQVMLLYLEDFDAAEISEVTGLSPGAVATRIHRIKSTLAQRLGLERGDHE
jgi:RNA polymerase sigma-70 factor, ECF subfamily